jgi:putative protein kinase ArgK-like GTPase of G3E family
MNGIESGRVFFRSMATRGAGQLPPGLPTVIGLAKAAGYDLVIVETPGIGQGDTTIAPVSDVSLYVRIMSSSPAQIGWDGGVWLVHSPHRTAESYIRIHTPGR